MSMPVPEGRPIAARFVRGGHWLLLEELVKAGDGYRCAAESDAAGHPPCKRCRMVERGAASTCRSSVLRQN